MNKLNSIIIQTLEPVLATDNASLEVILQTALNRLDLICYILLLAVSVLSSALVVYIIYKCIDKFITH